MSDRKGWMTRVWQMLDDNLRSASEKARKLVRGIRIARALLWLLALLYIAGGVAGVLWPGYLQWIVLAGAITFAVPFILLAFLVALPLKAKSVVRLVDMGYPKNARELGIRMVARKLHEESIETEELLVETAWNESRKMLRKYRARAERLKQELDEEPDPADPAPTESDPSTRRASDDE